MPQKTIRHPIATIRAQEIVLLIPCLILVIGILGFIELADLVGAGTTQQCDERIIRILRDPADLSRPIGPVWLAEVGRDLTALGGVAVITLVLLGVVGFLAFERKWRSMCLVLLATVSGLGVSSILKHAFARPRPTIVPYLSGAYTSSFPSGHSMMSAIVYLTLGALLARTVADRPTRLFAMAIALLISILVGLSRIYMGVHYPTDVLAGWVAGGVWAIFCWIIAALLQQRGQIEQPSGFTTP